MSRIYYIVCIFISLSNFVLAQDPIAYYPFDGDATDQSGNGHHGSENGGIAYTADRFGNASSAASFDGVNDEIDIGNFGVGNRTAITLIAWVKINSGASVTGHIIDRWLGIGDLREFELRYDASGHPFFTLGDENGLASVVAEGIIDIRDDTWHLLVSTWDANGDGYGKLYLDGALIATSPSTQLLAYKATSLNTIIGFDTDGNDAFDGSLDDIRIYSRELTATEIADIFASESGIPTITSFIPTSGPVGTSVIITGTNFDPTPANNIVYFGATKATVTAATETELTVTVPIGTTYQPITVLNNGLLGFSAEPFIVKFGGEGIDVNSLDPKVDYTAGSKPYGEALADFNGDGKTDIVVVNFTSNTASIYKNTSTAQGIISYDSKLDFATGTSPTSVAVVDLDGDGKMDLIVTNSVDNTVSVFKNTSTSGTIDFAAKLDYVTGTNPQAVAVVDFDGDGKVDIAVADHTDNTISIIRNTSTSIGNINYDSRVIFTTGTNPISIAIGDLDNDGKLDLALSNLYGNSISILRNVSLGVGNIDFDTKVDYATGDNPYSIAVGDLDFDGKVDLVTTNYFSNTVSVFANISTGDGSISFADKSDFTTGTNPNSVAIGDIDGDGKVDLGITNKGSHKVSIFKNASTIGSISFDNKIDFSAGNHPNSIAIGDFDGDGKYDFAITDYDGWELSILRNTIPFPPPTISSFAPLSITAGTTVSISGTGFIGVTEVSFGGTPASSFIVVSPTNITAVVDSGTSGDISITTPGGTVSIPGFNFIPTPVINSVSPLSGSIGAEVVISGTNFSTTETILLTEALLTGGGTKTWKLRPASGSIGVGPEIGSEGYWPWGVDISGDRPCMFNDEFIFKAGGEYEYQANGDIYAEAYMGIAEGCVDESSLILASPDATDWTSGIHSFTFTEATDISNALITVSGTGAFIGLPKAFNGGSYTTTPPLVDGSVTYEVIDYLNDGVNETLELSIDASIDGSLFWKFVLSKDGANVFIPPPNNVEFNGTPATVTTTSSTDLTVTVPTAATSGTISVTVHDKTAISANSFTLLSSETDILTFFLPNQTAPTSIDQVNHTVDIEAAFGTDVTSLVATFSLSTGATAIVNAVTQVSGTTTNNFTSIVNYTILAEDGTTTQNWIANVTVALNSAKDILTFSIPEQTGPSIINGTTHKVEIEVTNGTNTLSLIPTFTLSPGANVYVNSFLQVSGTTPNDFSGPVAYDVVAEDGTSSGWDISVSVQEDLANPEIGTTTLPTLFEAGSSGSEASITVTDNVGIELVTFYSKKTTDTNFSGQVVSSTDDTYSVTLTQNQITTTGLIYYFFAEDANQNDVSTDTVQLVIQYTNSTSPSIPNLSSGGTAQDWRMFSIPFDITNKSISATIEPVFGTYDDTKWRLFHYKNDTQGFVEYTKGLASIERGKGYWFNSVENKSIQVGAGVAPTNTNQNLAVIQLTSGWNQIGNPYTFSISWDDVLSHNGVVNEVESNLRVFSGGTSLINTTTLNAFAGAYLKANEAITLEIPLKSTTGGRLSGIDEFEAGWLLNMQIDAGVFSNTVSGFGMHPEAMSGNDRFDQIRAPRFANYIDATFDHPEYFMPDFSRDIVPEQEYFVWEFSVSSNIEHELRKLSWNKLQLGSNKNLILADKSNGNIIDMLSNNNYSYNNDNNRNFKIIYGNSDFLLSQFKHPSIFLGANYPNPFSIGTTIPYTIYGSEDEFKVKLTIYSVSGKLIKTLVNETKSSGIYTVSWDGTGPNSKPLSGIYIYSLDVETDQGVQSERMKMIVR